MTKEQIVKLTEDFVRKTFESDTTGHDWWHTDRVRKLALKIGKEEKADLFVVELGALLHDVADWKFHGGDAQMNSKVSREFLRDKLDEKTLEELCELVDNVSFKGAGVDTRPRTIEGQVVQDADRLDALGAIGIARCFAYGGSKGRELYNPDLKPEIHKDFEAYKKSTGPSLNHFNEKLFLLKDLLNTTTAKEMAKNRHSFVEEFYNRFLKEWEAED